MDMLKITSTDSLDTAQVKVDTGNPGETISPYITGKFCEHLYSNVYNGMHAQILMNPTFGDWPFVGGQHPDGGILRTSDEELIEKHIRSRAGRNSGEGAQLLADKMVEARRDDLAHYWIKAGNRDDIRTTSDAGPHGGRAQRIEVQYEAQGIAQACCLPLHRCRDYEYRMIVRSDNLEKLYLSIAAGTDDPCSIETIQLSDAWQTITGRVSIPKETGPDDGIFVIAITAPGKGQFVIDRLLLYPADHIRGNDPDIIRFHKQNPLPILRWPGGNFVSGYHWEDGIGPVDERPTLDNPAWANIEPNLFGTAEFIEFCEDAGCEPMICVNAGNGTPEEAADWVEYCNGSIDTLMGALRAEHGYPEPFNIKYWEVGNELSGSHQVGWTSSAGYPDRYKQFSAAMAQRDNSIILMACGAPVLWGGWTMHGEDRGVGDIVWTDEDGWDWNRRTVRQNKDNLQWITDHILEGGNQPASTDPLALYHDFMAMPIKHEEWYGRAEEIMKEEGIKDPRLAITELQLFARALAAEEGEADNLTHETMVSPSTVAECAFSGLYYHMAMRMAPFIPMITHSATVNHGGGLRKQKEVVYANPCDYSRAMFVPFGGMQVCPIDLSCGTQPAAGLISKVTAGMEVPVIDAVAASDDNGTVRVSLINRCTAGAVQAQIEIPNASGEAEITVICSELPWDANTLEEPEKIIPVSSSVSITDGAISLELPLYSVTILKVQTN